MRTFLFFKMKKNVSKVQKVLTSVLASVLASRGFVRLCCPLVDIVAYDKIMYLTAVPLMTTTAVALM